MEQGYQKALDACLSLFCDQLTSHLIAAKLLEKEVFTKIDVQGIEAERTAFERNNKLITILKTKGHNSFSNFVDILLDPEISKENLVIKLNDELRKQKLEPINIAKRRKALESTNSIEEIAYKFKSAKVLIITYTAYNRSAPTSKSSENYNKRTIETCKALEYMWTMNFKVLPTVVNQLNLTKLKRALEEFSKKCSTDSETDAAFVFVISKGGENYVRCNCESNLKIEEIVDCFSAQNCPGMRGKPKLFFIQNSLDDTDNAINKKIAKIPEVCASAQADCEPPLQNIEDVFIATAYGQSRWCCGDDAKAESTQLLRTLIDLVQDDEQNNCCIERLLTKVQNKIRKDNATTAADGKPIHVPSFCSHLSRDFYFKAN